LVRGKGARLVIVTDKILRPPGAIRVGKKDLLICADTTARVALAGLALVLPCIVTIAPAGMVLVLSPGVVATVFTWTEQVAF